MTEADVAATWVALYRRTPAAAALVPIARDISEEAAARGCNAMELLQNCLVAWPEYRAHCHGPGIAWNLPDNLLGIVGKNGGAPDAPTCHVARLVEWVLDGKKPQAKGNRRETGIAPSSEFAPGMREVKL